VVISLGLHASIASALLAQSLNVYFGNLHSHTSYSDGSLTPEEAYRHARDVARIDFLAITEHNHAGAPSRIAGDHLLYSGSSSTSLISTANRLTASGTFVAIYGQEFSSIGSGNHTNVFEVSEVIDTSDVANGRYDTLLNEWLPAHLDSTGRQALLLLNHPTLPSSPDSKEYGRDDFPSDEAWITALDASAQLINILNGPSHTPGTGLRPSGDAEPEFLRYLNMGFHLAPTADQDNHRPNWGDATEGRTGVLALALTKEAILEALRARHVYASEDRNLHVIARVNGNLMGSRLTGADVPAAGSELNISIDLRDPDEPHAIYDVEVFGDEIGGVPADLVGTGHSEGDGSVEIHGVRYSGGNQYFFLKVIQSDDDGELKDRVWTAPIWFEPNAPAPAEISQVSLSVDLVREEAVVTNLGTMAVDLSGWTLVSLRGNQTFSFPAGLTLAPGRAVTVTSGPTTRQEPPDILSWIASHMWSNSGDPGELRNASGQLVASSP
jgi:hypothetical protein